MAHKDPPQHPADRRAIYPLTDSKNSPDRLQTRCREPRPLENKMPVLVCLVCICTTKSHAHHFQHHFTLAFFFFFQSQRKHPVEVCTLSTGLSVYILQNAD